MQKKVIVVGAGVGGLAAAITLAARGVDTLLLEASPFVGGKMHAVSIGDQQVDMGPSVLTMRKVFDELFALGGQRLEDAVTLTPLQTLARHVWDTGEQLDLCDNPQLNEKAIGRLFGIEAAGGYRALMAHAAKLYGLAGDTFIYAPKPSLGQAAWRFGRRVWSAPQDMDALRTMDAALGQFFPNTPKLRQLFGRYATYSGASPLHAPASLALIAHVEQMGVWHVAEGISGLGRALAKLAQSLGVKIRLSSPVLQIDDASQQRRKKVVLEHGESLDADAVVLNTDLRAQRQQHLWPAAASEVGPTQTPVANGLSHIAFGLVGRVRGRALANHNVFFSQHGSHDEFRAIFDQHALPVEPTVYVCAPDRSPSAQPGEMNQSERLFCLTNAPPMRKALTMAQVAERQRLLFDMLSRCGVDISLDHAPYVMTPTDFAARFPATDGAIYGEPPHSWHSFMSRPGAQTKQRQVFAAGGSHHPGSGVPMAALSGRFAAMAAIASWSSGPTLWQRAFGSGASHQDLAAM